MRRPPKPPATRAGCLDPAWPRPCPARWCRHALPRGGCVLDVTETGAQPVDVVAALLGVSEVRVYQIQARGLQRARNYLQGQGFDIVTVTQEIDTGDV